MRHRIITAVLIVWIAALHSASFAQITEDCALPPLKPILEYTDLSSDVTRYELAYLGVYTFYRPLAQAGCAEIFEGSGHPDMWTDHWAYPALEMEYSIGPFMGFWNEDFRGDMILGIRDYLGNITSLSGRVVKTVYHVEIPGLDEPLKTSGNVDEITFNSWLFSSFDLSKKKVSLGDVIAPLNKMVQYINENSPLITKIPVEIPKMANSCVEGMVRIENGNVPYCIDMYEFPNQRAAIPYSKMTGRAAALVCAMEGKRLCTAAEWETACRGREDAAYVYGDHYVGGFCNDFLMSRGAGAAKASGATLGCVNGYGLYDMSGNLAEWTAPEPQPDGTTLQRVRGGSFSQDDDETALSCGGAKTPVIDEHRNSFSPGFETDGTRCCTD